MAPTAALPEAAVHDAERLVLLGSDVAYDAVLTGGVTVGSGVVVGPGARLHKSVIFDDAVIGSRARIERSVVGHGARVGAGAVLIGTVLGDGAVVGSGCELQDVRVRPGVVLPEHGIRFAVDA